MTRYELLEHRSHWTVEATTPHEANGHAWNKNVSVEIVASDVDRALATFHDAYPEATVHVVRKTSRHRTMLIDREES